MRNLGDMRRRRERHDEFTRFRRLEAGDSKRQRQVRCFCSPAGAAGVPPPALLSGEARPSSCDRSWFKAIGYIFCLIRPISLMRETNILRDRPAGAGACMASEASVPLGNPWGWGWGWPCGRSVGSPRHGSTWHGVMARHGTAWPSPSPCHSLLCTPQHT